MAAKANPDTADLRYLEANNVRCAAGTLADFRVCTEDAESLGSIQGVLISPSARRCEYFVVESKGIFSHRRFLIPFDAEVVQDEPGTLKVHGKRDELELQAFTPSSVPEFSDEDLLTTMFAKDAA
jgi:hypothetical protein